MAMNPLPPQAFTKETLHKAYTWLLTQSPSIKEMASTQDMLISLYLKAQRSGEASLDTPSIQNFKQELKSLAGIMGDLQTPPRAQQMPPSANFNSHSSASAVTPLTNHNHAQVSASAPSHGLSLTGLDATSMQAIMEVKQTLNLSSEIEAIRALIALGHKQFKKI
ncbi:MAG: hypothetical protein WA160_11670 [Pseudobdellovibrio sp.]